MGIEVLEEFIGEISRDIIIRVRDKEGNIRNYRWSATIYRPPSAIKSELLELEKKGYLAVAYEDRTKFYKPLASF